MKTIMERRRYKCEHSGTFHGFDVARGLPHPLQRRTTFPSGSECAPFAALNSQLPVRQHRDVALKTWGNRNVCSTGSNSIRKG
jgi:hypothetical protein